MNYISFSDRLIEWYEVNKRDLPWRNTRNPYIIWISEIILQQTRVDQGISYFNKFISKFPDISSLANAEEVEVLSLWQGLGYYSRARNLHSAAKEIDRNKGSFPRTYSEILAMKGVGPYTAAAISSFAFDLPHAVIDGNVNRVITRLFGLDAPVNSTEVKKEIERRTTELFNPKQAALHNQAMMEFGALHCTISSPKCSSCPFNQECQAYLMNKTHEIPLKGKKIRKTQRFFNYMVFRNGDSIILNKRTENDIWKNLYDFPVINSTGKNEDVPSLLPEDGAPYHANLIGKSNWVKHLLSHQDIYARFWEFSIEEPERILRGNWKLVRMDELDSYPFPKLIENYLNAS
jgi:A/G-specific adenine glycosylase